MNTSKVGAIRDSAQLIASDNTTSSTHATGLFDDEPGYRRNLVARRKRNRWHRNEPERVEMQDRSEMLVRLEAPSRCPNELESFAELSEPVAMDHRQTGGFVVIGKDRVIGVSVGADVDAVDIEYTVDVNQQQWPLIHQPRLRIRHKGRKRVHGSTPTASVRSGSQSNYRGVRTEEAVLPLIDVTYDSTISMDSLRWLGELLPSIVAESVDCPEEPWIGPPAEGDIEIRFHPRSSLDVGELNCVIEVRTKLFASRGEDKQRRVDLIRDSLSSTGQFGKLGVWLILLEGAWAQSNLGDDRPAQ